MWFLTVNSLMCRMQPISGLVFPIATHTMICRSRSLRTAIRDTCASTGLRSEPGWRTGAVGIWLFYVQHQFEDVYWERSSEWSYADAALRGSSYLRLPKVLQFFTGNIGLHHVHHLNSKIPNYNLQRANDETPVFDRVPRMSFWDGLRATRLKLWDEHARRLVSWGDIRRGRRAAFAGS